MRKLYSTLYKSVVRATHDLIKEIQATTPDLRYWSWENRMDEDRMPRVPLIGVNGFALEENHGLWRVQFGITVSTVDDANLLEEAELIDAVHEVFGDGKKISLRDPDDASIINELVSVDFQVAPMGQTQLRNYRTIGVEVLRTGT